MNVLIVDDSNEDRLLLRDIVRRNGHQPIEATNGQEALALAVSHHPDLIITDILMPVMDGFRLCKKIREDATLKSTPLIFYSASYTESKDQALGDYVGADGYLIKPMDPLAFWPEVERILIRVGVERPPRPESIREDREYLERYGEIVSAKLEEKVRELQLALERSQQAEKELQKWGHIFEFAEWGIGVSSADGQTLELMNPAFARTHGYCTAELLGRPMLDLIAPESRAELPEQIRTACHEGHSIFETRHLRKDGVVFPCLMDVTAVKDEKDAVQYLVINTQDLSHSKQLEAQLRQAQKMEAIGTLAGGIAHDFNNILMAILGYADMVLDGLPPGSRFHEYQREVVNAGQRAKELVKQILAFSRQSERSVMPVQIHLIVKEALKLLRASIPTTIEIRTDIDSQCGQVLADPSQIHQILMNLCTNAYHAMREQGGTLTVTLKQGQIDPHDYSAGSTLCPGSYITLVVSDTGCGMDRAIQEKIFDPYFTTKKKGEGTGLGLAVVMSIVKSCAGAITVESVPGAGSTFRVYLPRIVGEVTSQEVRTGIGIRGGSERILVVDDEPAIAQMEQKMLESLGYQVTTLNRSHEALSLFRATPHNFDLVVTDMTMPEMNGVELASRLLELRADLPIILCTGFNDTINEEKARALGIRRYLMKPIVKRDLAAAIHQALEEKVSAMAG